MAGLGWMILGAWTLNRNVRRWDYSLPLRLWVFCGGTFRQRGFSWATWAAHFLGFSFSFLAVLAARKDSRMAVAGIVLVWPFVFDSIFTLFRRLRKGENIFRAHRSHLYQRLVQKGWTHGQVSSLYAVLAGIGIVPAVMFVRWPTAGSWLIVILLPLLVGGLWSLVVCQEKRFFLNNMQYYISTGFLCSFLCEW